MPARLSAEKTQAFADDDPALAELEVVRKGDPDCVLVAGDNLSALRLLAQGPTRFALAYLDPPFLTGRETRCPHALSADGPAPELFGNCEFAPVSTVIGKGLEARGKV